MTYAPAGKLATPPYARYRADTGRKRTFNFFVSGRRSVDQGADRVASKAEKAAANYSMRRRG
jgi:hypothetical protein